MISIYVLLPEDFPKLHFMGHLETMDIRSIYVLLCEDFVKHYFYELFGNYGDRPMPMVGV